MQAKIAVKAKVFYAETLDWTLEQFKLPSGDYWLIKYDGDIVGGIGGPEVLEAAVELKFQLYPEILLNLGL